MEVSDDRYIAMGTAIGDAITVAVTHLRRSNAKTKLIVFATDGANNVGTVDPATAAEIAKAFGIKIYAIGIGEKGRVGFPVIVKDELGNEREILQYLTDEINEPLMHELAQITSGKYFRVENANAFSEAISSIDQMEKAKVDISTFQRFTELAWPYLALALLLVFLEGYALHTKWLKVP